MNHTCNGDIFIRWGKKWGRCFMDGSVFELREGTEFCPACRRPWTASGDNGDWNPDKDDEVLRKIDLPQLKFMLEEKAKKVERLEQELEQWKTMFYEKAGIERPA